MELHDTLNLRIDEIQKKLREANYQCNQLRDIVKDAFQEDSTLVAPPQPEVIAPPIEVSEKAPAEAGPIIIKDEPILAGKPVTQSVPPPPPVPQARQEPRTVRPPVRKKPFFSRKKEEAKPKSQAKRDWEKFIGENLINKIGIAILTIGIAIFVKFAIDMEWINEFGRVAVGIGAGGILLGLAHWMRTKYKAFSSVLIGGGLAILYFTITIAYQEYALFPQTVAFGIMVVITAFAIAMSLAYDRKEIAILALLGGFGAPFMVMSGSGNVVVLFSYLMILNIGITVLAWFKNWRILNIIGYVATVMIYAGWLGLQLVRGEDFPMGAGIIFGLLFFTLFFVMFVLNQVRTGKKLGFLDYVMLLSNSSLFYGASMLIMEHEDLSMYRGLLTAAMGVFHFAFILPLRNREGVDKNLIILLIGLVLSFLTLAIPVQLEGNYITLFWATEAVLVLYLSQRAEIRLMKFSAVMISGLMLISLSWDWINLYLDMQGGKLLPIANQAFITGIVSLASVLGMQWLFKKETPGTLVGRIRTEVWTRIYFYLGIVVMYMVGVTELTHQVDRLVGNGDVVSLAFGTFNALFLSALLLYARWKKIGFITLVTLIASSILVIAYIVGFRENIVGLREDITYDGGAIGPFLFHYVFIALMAVMVGLNLAQIKSKYGFQSLIGKISLWVGSFVLVFMASAELEHLVVLAGFEPSVSVHHLLETARKVGFPILWGACGFIMIYLGMKFKHLHLRIAALVLFLLTLVKLFVYDIRDIPPAGKIAAFISLGVLLLVISFMYQRLKRLLVDEENQKQAAAEEAAAQSAVMRAETSSDATVVATSTEANEETASPEVPPPAPPVDPAKEETDNPESE